MAEYETSARAHASGGGALLHAHQPLLPSAENRAEWATKIAHNLEQASAHAQESLDALVHAATTHDVAGYGDARTTADAALERLRQLGRAAKEHLRDAATPEVRSKLDHASSLIERAEQGLASAPAAPEPVAPQLRAQTALLRALPPATRVDGSTKQVFDRARQEVTQVLRGMAFSDITSLELILREFPTNEIAVRFNRFSTPVRTEMLAMLRDGKVRARARAIEAALPPVPEEVHEVAPVLDLRTPVVTTVGRENVSVLESVAPSVQSVFAPAFKPADQKHSDLVAWMHDSLLLTENDSLLITQLSAAYVAARDAVDQAATAELGGTIVGTVARMRGAFNALTELHAKVINQTLIGTSPEQDLANAQLQQDVEARLAGVEQAMKRATALAVLSMTPRDFRGHGVTEQPLGVVVDAPAGEIRSQLQVELVHTIRVLDIARRIPAALESKHLVSAQSFDGGIFGEVCALASRPLDLALLKAIIGPQWNQLEALAPAQSKPSVALDQATKQATHTGWLADTGKFDIDDAAVFIRSGDAITVLRSLYTTDDNSRAELLLQLKQRKLLDPFCQQLGWMHIKQLHDSLSSGHEEIKTDLQKHFIGGKDKFGPSLGAEWDSHETSLYAMFNKLGAYGKLQNFVWDIATFGFHSQYGQTRDANTSGMISDGEFHNASINIANRTALMAAVSMVTGGAADKYIRGGLETVSAARAIAAGAAGGTVGGLSGHLATDAYSVYLSEEKEAFSSPEDYVKTALMGGAFGGALVSLGHMSKIARAYLPPGDAPLALPAAGESAAAGDGLLKIPSFEKPSALAESVGDTPLAQTGEVPGTAEHVGGSPRKAPTDTSVAIDTSLNSPAVRPNGPVVTRLPGVFDLANPTTPIPPEWIIKETLGTGGKITTEVVAPNGATGQLERSYDRMTRQWTLELAFFDPTMPRWIDAGVPLVPGKGTPLIAFLDMRQMHVAGIAPGEIKVVKMSTIQNLETICELEAAHRQGKTPADVIAGTHSIRYAQTEIIQSGHDISRIRIEGGQRSTFEAVIELQELNGTRSPAETDALLAKYGIARTDEAFWNFNIYIELTPTK